ncbi:hypothetical protein B0H12DRAFT_1127573 [Mycena haematopus]|nr:hypothetical protein B0H12DRAFT_1127573 [Mycena haematopus]
MPHQGFQALPCELHPEIARWAKPQEIVALALASKLFHQDFEPILYHTVVLYDKMQCQQLYNAIHTNSVRHLQRRSRIKYLGFVLPMDTSFPSAEQILSLCDDIVDIFILSGGSIFLQSVGQLLERRADQIHVSRLSVDVVDMCNELPVVRRQPLSSSRPIPGPFISLFSRLTHLDVRSVVEKDDWSYWTGLAALPALTHLAFHVWGRRPAPIRILTKALVHCKSLRVLVLFHAGKGGEYNGLDIRDSRFRIRECTDALRDWVNSCRGDDDFWL